MAWFWTDALAALLVEHDLVAPTRLVGWVECPVAYRLREGEEAIALARQLLDVESPGRCGDFAAGPS